MEETKDQTSSNTLGRAQIFRNLALFAVFCYSSVYLFYYFVKKRPDMLKRQQEIAQQVDGGYDTTSFVANMGLSKDYFVIAKDLNSKNTTRSIKNIIIDKLVNNNEDQALSILLKILEGAFGEESQAYAAGELIKNINSNFGSNAVSALRRYITKLSPKALLELNNLSLKKDPLEIRDSLRKLGNENKKMTFLLASALFIDGRTPYDTIEVIYENYTNEEIPFSPKPSDIIAGERDLQKLFSSYLKNSIDEIEKHKLPWVLKSIYRNNIELFKKYLSQFSSSEVFSGKKSIVFLDLLEKAQKYQLASSDVETIVKGLCGMLSEQDLLALSTMSPLVARQALNMTIYSTEDTTLVSRSVLLLLSKKIDNSEFGLYRLVKASNNDSAIKLAKSLSMIILWEGNEKQEGALKKEFNEFVSKVGVSDTYRIIKSADNSRLFRLLIELFGKKIPQKFLMAELENEDPQVRMLVLKSIVFPERIETRYALKKYYNKETNLEVRKMYENLFSDIIN